MQAVLLAVIQSDTSDCFQDGFQDDLLASKHDFFHSGMISCCLSSTCTVQFLLSTAKGRCLTFKIHFRVSDFQFGSAAGRAAFSFKLASISTREPGSFCPRWQDASAVLSVIHLHRYGIYARQSRQHLGFRAQLLEDCYEEGSKPRLTVFGIYPVVCVWRAGLLAEAGHKSA